MLLKNTNRELVSKFAHIGEPVVERLVLDFGLDEKAAADAFFFVGDVCAGCGYVNRTL